MSDAGPVVLGPNQPERFYRGGARIAAFRAATASGAAPPHGDHLPEDWVGSATAVFGTAADGLTRLPGGELLRDAISNDPQGYLGPQHVQEFGTSPALLVKLLDAGERLPVHCHPDDPFARQHLASACGKTEAWVVIDASPGSEVHLGFRDDVPPDLLRGWVDGQSPAMLAALNRVPVRRGDAILVPAGLPHAIGAGVFVVELQQPTDFSVLLEWDSFRIDGRAEGHLGLGYGLALDCVDRSAWDAGRLAALRGTSSGAQAGPVASVFPAAAARYFAAQRIRPGGGTITAGPGFAVLIVLAGQGLLRTEQAGDLAVSRGMTILVPYAAGDSELSGDCELIRCLPPGGAGPGA